MDEEYVAKDVKIKWKGNFEMELVYKKIKQWFDSRGYSNFKELKYIERVKPNGKQLEIAWEAKKEVSDYFVNCIQLTFLVIGLNSVEVEKDGKKIKMHNAEIEMVFNAFLIKNANKKFTEETFMKKLYESYIIKDRIEEYKIEIYDNIYGLVNEVKLMLELYEF